MLAASTGNERRAMEAFDLLPADVRQAIRDCEFLICIERVPKGMNWNAVAERIRGITTHAEADAFDVWLLKAGLRWPR